MKKMERERGVSNARKPFKQPVQLVNQDLMNEFNNMMIRIKRHLFGIPGDTIKPENEELDRLTNKVMEALKKETEPTIHYYE